MFKLRELSVDQRTEKGDTEIWFQENGRAPEYFATAPRHNAETIIITLNEQIRMLNAAARRYDSDY